jgi:hypothetical protein
MTKGLVADIAQARLLRGRRAGAQRLDAALDLESRRIKQTIRISEKAEKFTTTLGW